MLSKLMLAALFLMKGHAIDTNIEWGLESDHGAVHLYCDESQSSVRIPLGPDTEFIAHTHPDGTQPYPSADDIQIARETGVPDIVVSANAAYLVGPDGTVTKL